MSTRPDIAAHLPIGRHLALMPALGLLQMSGLDPQSRARGARDGGETGASWQSQPGVLSKGLASFLKTPRKDESFKTARNVEHNAGVRAPRLDAHVFPAVVEQRDEAYTLPSRRCHGLRPPRIDGDVRAVGGIELKELHEDRAARLRTRCMARGRRIADVAPRGIIAALVLKDSLEDEEFFTARMGVRREGAVGGVSNDGRCASDLATDTVEHSALDTRHWRRHPGRFFGMDRGTLGEVGIDAHDRLRLV